MNTWTMGFAVISLVTTLACGGGTPAPAAATPAAGGAADSATDRCLAIAGAKRERRADAPEKVTVKHILVKYAGAKKAPDTVTRTRGDACLRAQEARSKLEGGASFADVVRDYSEEQGAVSREGSLGAIERSSVVPPFADAAFELHPGDVSHVVETEFGFHVIMRTE
jgi:NIMA-interacting peptidyl-prolyl cis-trans isomerase 1